MQGQEMEILSLLPTRLATILRHFISDWDKLQEICIRQGKKMAVRYQGNLRFPSGQERDVTSMECKEILSQMSQYSLYAFEEEIRRGYLTIPGGHRIGVTGRVVMEQGEVKTLRHITCLNMRISHEIRGCADCLLPYVASDHQLHSTLILSPPGGGKTTLLRDLIRNISQQRNVALVDERSEIAGCYQGIPQRDVGPCCDVIDGCPKTIGMEMVLRSMGPEVIAVDEIGTKEDYCVMKQALVSGCALLATMHGEDLSSVREQGMFSRYVVLGKSQEPGRVKGIYDERGQKIWG